MLIYGLVGLVCQQSRRYYSHLPTDEAQWTQMRSQKTQEITEHMVLSFIHLSIIYRSSDLITYLHVVRHREVPHKKLSLSLRLRETGQRLL